MITFYLYAVNSGEWVIKFHVRPKAREHGLRWLCGLVGGQEQMDAQARGAGGENTLYAFGSI